LVYCNIRSIAEGLTPCYAISGSTDPNQWGSIPIVSNSTWDAVECNWFVNGYRLASEAEWEYVAQYDNGRTYPWGETAPSSTLCNFNNNVGSTTEVGSYPSGNSKLGLCDMGGNLSEWVWDWFDSYSTSPQIDPTGASSGSQRVLRSIWWSFTDPSGLRCVTRSRTEPSNAAFLHGLRIVRLP